MASLIDKVKGGADTTDHISGTTPDTTGTTRTHPPLAPTEVAALSNGLSPIRITSQDLSCTLTYQPEERNYRIVLYSRNRQVSDEVIDPTDRKKKAVTDIMYKGLIGIHLHSAGVILLLDQEDNYRGEARVNQPPAQIVSGNFSPEAAERDQGRFATLDLDTCSEKNPILIAPNHGSFHMAIKPLPKEKGRWGVYLSNPKGNIREDSPAVAILEPGCSHLIDRQFFTRRATASDGGIDARNWNKAIADPALMRLSVNDQDQLTVEEMFTIAGLTLIQDPYHPLSLGSHAPESADQQDEHRRHYAKLLVDLLKETASEEGERGLEHALRRDRERAINAAAKAIQKRNQDGVSKLALELAIKEVLAPFYAEASGGDGTHITHETIGLLNAITSEIIGWLEADTSRALAATAVERAIDQAAPLLSWEGIGEVMSMELPTIETSTMSEKSNLLGDLVGQGKKLLTDKLFVREIRQISKAVKEFEENKEEQQNQIQLFDQLIAKMVTETFEKLLVRLAVKGFLVQTERERRKALAYDTRQTTEIALGNQDLDAVLKRYDGYALFLERAFHDRLSQSLDNLIQDFQHGANDANEKDLPTRSFITYLVALRTSGGKINPTKEITAPSVSSLEHIPDAIPDILVKQPNPGEQTALISVVHREGVLLEAPFSLAPRPKHVPDEVPNGLWYAFQDLTKFIMSYHLTGESQHSKDKKQQDAIILNYTHHLLLKVLNLYREIKKEVVSEGWENVVQTLGNSTGLLEVKLGANPDEEVLDLRSRPGYVTEEPMNLQHELHRILVEQEKAGNVELGAFRFKRRVRFGMGGKDSIMLPIQILCKEGVIQIRAQYNEEVFSKSVRLLAEDEVESIGSIFSKLSADGSDPFSLEDKKKPIKKLSQQGIQNLIGSSPFFNPFSLYEQTKISEFDHCFHLYHKGEIVLREESKDIAFFVLIKGHVRAVHGGFDLRKYGPDSMFGEMSFITGRPQVLTVESLTNVMVLRVDREMFQQFGPESREKFKDHIIAQQVANLAETTRTMQQQLAGGTHAILKTAPPPDHSNLEGEVAEITPEEAIPMIDRLPFFDQFSTFEKRRIIAFFTSFRTYQPNGEIIREGMTDRAFFILIKGEVIIIKGDSIIVEFGPGEFFGDMAFLTSEPRTTSVRSKGEVLVLRLDPTLIERLGPEIREKIKDKFINKLAERQTQTMNLLKKR